MDTSNNIMKEDKRKLKTDMALKIALSTLLDSRNFNQITVSDLCKEAMISRATFYAHFADKYDLLGAWLSDIGLPIAADISCYERLKATANRLLSKNKMAIKNTLRHADCDTKEVVQGFMCHIVELFAKRQHGDAPGAEDTLLFTFCIGGLMQILTWQVEKDFPAQVDLVNPCLYAMLTRIMTWDAGQEDAP